MSAVLFACTVVELAVCASAPVVSAAGRYIQVVEDAALPPVLPGCPPLCPKAWTAAMNSKLAKQGTCANQCMPGEYCKRGHSLAHEEFSAKGVPTLKAARAHDYCAACPAGMYQDEDNRSSRCKLCFPGHFQSSSSGCTRCPTGKFQPGFGSNHCKACRPGEYRPAFNKYDIAVEQCSKCPLGQFTSQPAQSKCRTCAAGMFVHVPLAADKCDACACPGGKFVRSFERFKPTALFSVACRCTPCASGRFQAGFDSTSCLRCPVGKYGAKPGAQRCKGCPFGKFTARARSHCLRSCPTGKHRDLEKRKCEVCSGDKPFTFRDSFFGSGKLTCLVVCPLGYRTDSNHFCMACAAGQYQSKPGAHSCSPCTAGRFQPKTAQIHCHKCKRGKFLPRSGMAHGCRACVAGKYSTKDGATSCGTCDAKHKGLYFQNMPGQAACKMCPIGRTAAPLFGPATWCRKNIFFDPDDTVHDESRDDTFAPTAAPTPRPTPPLNTRTHPPTPCPAWRDCTAKAKKSHGAPLQNPFVAAPTTAAPTPPSAARIAARVAREKAAMLWRKQVVAKTAAAQTEYRKTHIDGVSVWALGTAAASLFVCMAYLVARSLSSATAPAPEPQHRSYAAGLRSNPHGGFAMAQAGGGASDGGRAGYGAAPMAMAPPDVAYYDSQG